MNEDKNKQGQNGQNGQQGKGQKGGRSADGRSRDEQGRFTDED
jgi:hypothetical protein